MAEWCCVFSVTRNTLTLTMGRGNTVINPRTMLIRALVFTCFRSILSCFLFASSGVVHLLLVIIRVSIDHRSKNHTKFYIPACHDSLMLQVVYCSNSKLTTVAPCPPQPIHATSPPPLTPPLTTPSLWAINRTGWNITFKVSIVFFLNQIKQIKVKL